ncbi:MAG: Ig-like domain-containing protein [Microbacterium sp.]
MRRRGVLVGALAGAAAVASIVAVSVVWPGLDAKRTPPTDVSVWALQTGAGSRYARVNTAVGELDTVRGISSPTAVAESASGGYLFSESFGKVTPIDEAMPVDLDETALKESVTTPPGTVEAAVAGDYVAYRTDSGAVFVGTLAGGAVSQLDPYRQGDADENTPEYAAEAIGLDEDGVLHAYSSARGEVLRYRIPTSEVAGADAVPDAPTAGDLDIVSAGETWFLVDVAAGRVWRRGVDAPVDVDLTGTVALAKSTVDGDALYVADEVGLLRVTARGSSPERVLGDGSREYGVPARPVSFQGHVYGAWLRVDGGVLWEDAGRGEIELDFGGSVLGDERRPVFTSTGSAMILNETRSGWVWTMPSGALVPSSQDWSLDDRTDEESEPSAEQAEVVLDPKPPVAVDDAFGVRAGSLAALPVLLNDHDPNTDVLSIDPTSVTGLDPGFGAVSVTDNGQRLAVQVAPDASGSATFSYRVTDGTSGAGLSSEPATVTLEVSSEHNSAPEFCGAPGCLATWPVPEVEPGGTVSVPVLNGWVDPEGDPILLLSVDNRSGVGAVASTPSGDIVYQHPDASAEASVIRLDVTVSDTHGATTTKELDVRVNASPVLRAESFAVEESLSAGGVTVDVAPHVTGTVGRLALTAARVLDDAAAEAVPSASGTSFDFTAKAPGTYLVGYTVTAGGDPATGIARITILPEDASADLATPPVIAFVRPKEDATLDVFEAVANPTRRVLLLSDVAPDVESGATLSVDVVGQRFIRVSGATADGAPGRLGVVRYTVSDGTDDAGSRVEGEATVYLLPSPPELAPIAVDDSVTVRAGAQLDIPVLGNDVAPSGGAITLNPASVASSAANGLAFASGSLLRYLAPTTPGDYRVEYSIFSTGAPRLADTAVVRVTVIDEESNRAPRPETLEGRVLSGQSTVVPFDRFGVDPDGDQVALERILTQPRAGSATISADGQSIVYTSVPGDSGQRSFEYSVVDSAGATGVGIVRIGVLDEQSNPSPVTFTDYVQVQAGEDNSIRVSPLANDIDPTGGSLVLGDVRPDVSPTLADGTASPEYVRQRGLIAGRDDTTVTIAAGDTPGTVSFLYDVESDSGNTARGLIVVKVVRDSVPNYPIVADTVLTAQTRASLPAGVDVVSGQVTWSGGDVDDLTLSLWGRPAGLSVVGRRIRGALPEQTRIVPFALAGVSTTGEEVTTYGFLRIPGDDDYTLALRTGIQAQTVTEGESVSFDLRDLVAVPAGTEIEVGDAVSASGARKSATCGRSGGTVVRYVAGSGAPWTDACTVPVRVAGQDDWTYLSVPVRITAVDPQPELRPASVTVGPGETQTFDLKRGMTSWQWRADWANVAYAVDYAGSAFDLELRDDGTLAVTGRDAAVPGTEEAATVRITSHPGVAPARLILRVGAAPSILPQGGTVSQQCSQASGTSCVITVTGAPGEVNPLPSTPLELVDVRATGTCEGVTFARGSDTTVVAEWEEDAAGATCTAAFSMRDAQGRRTNADRDGSLLLDLHGYPAAPAALTQSAYDDGTLTLHVDPGDARLAYPALTGFVVRWNGEVVAECQPDGTCPAISAPNGEEREYEAWAVNEVGESRTSVKTVAWAYDPPPAPAAVTVEPVVTGGEGGLVSLDITGIDTVEVGYFEITSESGQTQQVSVGRGDTDLTVARYRVGTNSLGPIRVTPFSRFAIPPGFTEATSGSAVTVYGNGIGAPRQASLTLSSASRGDGTSTVTAEGSASTGGDGSSLRYGFARTGSECAVAESGTSATFSGLPDGEEYGFVMCVESWWGGVSYGRTTTSATVRAVQSTAAPEGYTFVVDPLPRVDSSDSTAYWSIQDEPTSAEDPPTNNVAEFDGGPPTDVYDRDPGIRVRYRHTDWGTTSDWGAVTARAGSAPYQVWARWGVSSCVGGSELAMLGESSEDPEGGTAAFSFGNDALVFYDADGEVLSSTAGSWAVPVGAVRVEGIAASANWDAQGWGLDPASLTMSATCDPNLPADAGD